MRNQPWYFDGIRVAALFVSVVSFVLFVFVLCLIRNVASVSGLSIRDCHFCFL